MPHESISHFDNAAASWDEKPARRERTERAFAALQERIGLSPEMRVLDFGGATGLLARLLAPHVKSVCVADASEGMVSVLRKRIAEAGLTNVTALQLPSEADALTLPEADLVVTCMTLHHVPEPATVLSAFAHSLGGGGTVCIIDLDREDGSFHGDRTVPHNGFDRDELARQVEALGFRDIQTETTDEMTRETVDGPRAFPIFMLRGRLDA